MEKRNEGDLLFFITAVIMVMLWGYASISKVVEYDKFVAQMELAPASFMKSMAGFLGWFVPFIEIGLVGLLFQPQLRRLALALSFGLLAVFEVYIIFMLLSGLELPCTCGGLISKLQWKEHVIFNAVFMVITAFPFLYVRFKKNNPSNDIHRGVYN